MRWSSSRLARQISVFGEGREKFEKADMTPLSAYCTEEDMERPAHWPLEFISPSKIMLACSRALLS